ncbi:hypothetical protein HN51_022659 [Arachis hypogaea]|uniref:RING-CH-type domain-containing protein n=1 Tax=Arachis hypogaea TaxID=3818 RepID=A0A445EBQ5_ARAHY|nr:uncharacterized protein LOC112749051 [Arachis hypogaea]QHO53959.1 uncharacterized protein DS421_2g52540 [Arachis hypogaea]RYR72753.1 hypothetical protein Ahy_A02g006968 [Arachis hypogaea]
MSSIQMSHVDLEQGRILHHHHHHHSSVTGSDISLCFSDADDGGSCYSHFYSTNGGGSYDEDCCSYGGASNVADGDDDDCSVEIEIESGVPEIKVHLATNNKVESRDCRICHLGLEGDDGNNESGVPIELGCSCKDDLAAAHKNCAEAWFKIKGNRTCEICHTIARNVYSASEDTTEALSDINNNNISVTVGSAASTTISAPSSSSSETRRFWHGHRFLNFLLACMVFAFVISWLFHFNVPSS